MHVLRILWCGMLASGLIAAAAVGTSVAPAADSDRGVGLVSRATEIDARAAGINRYVPAAEGRDLAGNATCWREGRGDRATVIAMTSVTCPVSKKLAPALRRTEAAYADRGVRFVYINVSGVDSVDAMREQIESHGFDGLYLDDRERTIAQTLRADTTTEVFVIDQANTLMYRGAVNDQYGIGFTHSQPRERYLEAAIEAVLANRWPAVAATTAPGCLLDSPSDADDAASELSGAVTYTREIARIMQASCIECHRSDGIAPFSLDSYEDVARRARMIRAVIDEGVMPPWSAAGHEEGPSPWLNDRSLTADEKQAIAAWIEAGRPEGEPVDAPAPRTFPRSQWTIGEVDAVFQIPEPMAVQAEGVMPYQHVVVPTELAEDKWVRGFQIIPTAPEVVHHVLVFVVPGSAVGDRRALRRAVSGADGHFATYVPGNDAVVYPEGLGKRLPADSALVFQIHYTPNGTATRDQTKLGLLFADEQPRHIVRTVGISNSEIRIPAGARDHEEHAQQPVPREAMILSLTPHMHVRGSAFRCELEQPDGNRKLLLDVPRYDFNWQLRYAYREPLRVERGSTIHVTGWFDNSDANAANPDPTVTVEWGPQTDDEMLIGFVEFYFKP